MKKLNYLFCLAILLAFTNLSLNGQSQLKKWFVNAIVHGKLSGSFSKVSYFFTDEFN